MGTRLFIASIFSCALLVTATERVTVRLVDVGDDVDLNVVRWQHPVFTCFLETPVNGTISFDEFSSLPSSSHKFILTSDQVRCTAKVRITDVNDNGLWKIYSLNPDGERIEQIYRVIINSTNNQEIRDVEILPETYITAYGGAVKTVRINASEYVETESCHIKTNEGKQYQMPDLPDLAGIEWIYDPDTACGVKITLAENVIGNWMLFSKDKRHSRYIEQRLPFTVSVEETVQAALEHILIAEGRDIVVRLANSAGELQNTCELVPPERISINEASYSRQKSSAEFCEYKILKASLIYTGLWHIQYGNSTIYRAPINVIVKDEYVHFNENLVWQRNRVVDMNIGPENAVYCKIEDPLGRVVQEKLDKCHIYLNRPEEHHAGRWTLTVGLPGKIVAKKYNVMVALTNPDARPEVITNVQTEATQILLSCGLSVSDISIRNCKFLSPSGMLLLPSLGVSENGYSFYQPDILLDSNVTVTGCGLRITHASHSDRGIWRCTMENENYEPYYGFLNVHTLNPDEGSHKETEPVLTPSRNLAVFEGTGDVIVSCTIPSQIKYCYFRHSNGTVFNISPGVITDQLEYKGLGFEAGDCSVSFKNLQASDSGAWHCHVGLTDPRISERRATIMLTVMPPYTMMYNYMPDDDTSTIMFANHMEPLAIEYCRFVRSDGVGFTMDNAPRRYTRIYMNDYGQCGISIRNPTQEERSNWTMAVKLERDQREISAVLTPRVIRYSPNKTSPWVIWMCALMVTFMLVMFALLITSKDTKQKAGAFIRNSFRRKKNQNQVNNTAIPTPHNNHSYV